MMRSLALSLIFLLGCAGRGAPDAKGPGKPPPVESLDAACRSNDGAACAALAVRYFEGITVQRNGAPGVELADRACTLRAPRGCAWLRRLYPEGPFAPAATTPRPRPL